MRGEGGEREFGQVDVKLSQIGADPFDECGCCWSIDGYAVVVFGAADNPGDCFRCFEFVALDDKADLGDLLVQFSGPPGAASEQERCTGRGVVGVALEEGTDLVAFDELFGFIENDEFVRRDQAETAAFVKNRRGISIGPREAEDINLAMGDFENFLEGGGVFGAEQEVGAMEENDAVLR